MMCEYNMMARMAIDEWMGSDEADQYRLFQKVLKAQRETRMRMEQERQEWEEQKEDDTL